MGQDQSTLGDGHNMDFKSFPSPLHVGPTKRTFDDELQQSPTAKRAKRVRPNRKDRFKEPKGDKESNGNVNEKDRMSSDNVSGTGTAWKETPIIPPMPSAFERILEAHASKSAENSQKSEPKKKVFKKNDVEKNLKKSESRNREVKKNEAKATKDTENSAEWLSATEAKHQYPFNKGTSEVPAIAGPSKIKISKKKPANEHKELTPVSNFTPTRDYTFKAYPNPLPAIPQPFKQPESPETPNNNNNNNNNNATKSPPITDSDSSPATPPTPSPAPTFPSGTKTLKSINKQLRALSSQLTPTPTKRFRTHNKEQQQQQQEEEKNTETEHAAAAAATQEEVALLRADIARLHERLDRDGLRAAARHTMLFNALVKVAGDVGAMAGEVRVFGGGGGMLGEGVGGGSSGGGGSGDGEGGGGSAAAREVREKVNRSMLQSRKTLERCLGSYTVDMERAGTREEVAKYGGLAVQYAGDLFKTLG